MERNVADSKTGSVGTRHLPVLLFSFSVVRSVGAVDHVSDFVSTL